MNWLYYTVFSTKWTDYTIVLLVIWFINYNWLFINHPVLVIYPILVGPNHLPNHQLNVVDIPTKNQWTKNIKKHRAQPVPDDSTLAISSQLGPPAGSTKTCESRIHHVRLIGIVPRCGSTHKPWLVGGWATNPSEKWWSEFVSWDDFPFPFYMWKVIKFHGSKPPIRLSMITMFVVVSPKFLRHVHSFQIRSMKLSYQIQTTDQIRSMVGLIIPHTLWLCQNSYWKLPFIVDLPIENGDFPVMLVYQRVFARTNISLISLSSTMIFWTRTSQKTMNLARQG